MSEHDGETSGLEGFSRIRYLLVGSPGTTDDRADRAEGDAATAEPDPTEESD